ncbi:hypothetical protein D6779_09390 [Candidatus Parcubacteria bacterium]|nr:MAG: hypothetical protein D6779_09390 [Candidatus Parcubacteria bacterium]
MRAANVLDVGNERGAILAAIKQATAPEFRQALAGERNPYGEGNAAEIIVKQIKEIAITNRLIAKVFHEANGKSQVTV